MTPFLQIATASPSLKRGAKVKAIFISVDCVESFDGLEDVVDEKAVYGYVVEEPQPNANIVTIDFGTQAKQPIQFQRFTYCEPNGEITRQWEAISTGPFDVAYLPDHN
jgi:hypothetical protein